MKRLGYERFGFEVRVRSSGSRFGFEVRVRGSGSRSGFEVRVRGLGSTLGCGPVFLFNGNNVNNRS